MYAEIDGKQAHVRLTKKELRWLLSTVVSVVSFIAYHVVDTKVDIKLLRADLKACQGELRELKKVTLERERIEMPGPNPGHIPADGPPIIAPDTTRRVDK